MQQAFLHTLQPLWKRVPCGGMGRVAGRSLEFLDIFYRLLGSVYGALCELSYKPKVVLRAKCKFLQMLPCVKITS